MASVSISANGAMTSPYLYSTATVSEKSRSGTSVVFNVKIVTHLNSSTSFVGTGYKITGTVTAYGVSKSFTLKESSASWSGDSDHTVTGTLTVNLPTTVTSVTVGYKCAVSGLETGSKTGTSKSLTLSKVLATVTTVSNFEDTSNTTVYFSNPSKLKVRPYLNFYDKAGGTLLLTLFPPTSEVPTTGAVLNTSYAWDLDKEYSSGLTYRNKIRDILGAKTSAYVAVGLNTYSGSTKLGYSSKGVTFTNVLEPPTFNNFSFENADEKTLILTGNNPQQFISGYSTLKITISEADKATANKGATMSHYLINGVKYNYSDEFEQLIEKWNKTNVEVYAVDSRGLTTKKDLPCELIPYTPLKKGNITIKREGGVGEKTTLFYEGSIWNNWFSGETDKGVENKIKSVKYTYQIGTGDINVGETDITPTVAENSFSFENEIKGDTTTGFDISPIYNLVVTVEDELSSVEYVDLVPSGIPALAIYKNNVAVHGKYDTELGGTQIYGEAYLDGTPIEIKTEQKVLWQGGMYMRADHIAELSEKISEQKNGVVLVFSEYSSGASQNYMFNFHFIPKHYVSLHAGAGVSIMMTNNTMNKVAFKYLYIYDTQIKGNDVNNSTGTGSSGITYANNNFVLRYVIGV